MASNCKKTDRKKAQELARRQAEGSTAMEGYIVTEEGRRKARKLLRKLQTKRAQKP